MKLTHVISAADAETAQVARRTLVRLAETDVAQWCIAPTGLGMAKVSAGLDVEHLEAPFGGRFDFRTGRALDTMIGRFTPDAIIAWDREAAERLSGLSSTKLGWVPPKMLPGGYKYFSGVLAANALRGQVAASVGWEEERIHKIPVPVDTDSSSTEITRKQVYTPSQSPVIVCFSPLELSQGLETLFEAMERLPDIYAWIIGDGPDEQALADYALERGVRPRVRFLGLEDHPAQYCRSADMVIAVRPTDDLALGVLEGWACGTPVIACDALGPGTLIEHKKNGILVPVTDAPSLAEAVKWVLRDKAFAQKIGGAGKSSYDETGGAPALVKSITAAVEAASAMGDGSEG